MADAKKLTYPVAVRNTFSGKGHAVLLPRPLAFRYAVGDTETATVSGFAQPALP